MTKKSILSAAMCCVFVLMPFIKISAQQTKFIQDFPDKRFIHFPRGTCNPINNGIHPPYRTYDGTNNNISSSSKKEWGAADIPLFRELPAAYDASDPNNAMNGVSRPSPRQISNVIVDEPVTQFNSRNLSAFVYNWGQFIDHDITLTPQGNTELVPIPLPVGELVFTVPIPFSRSEVRAGTGITNARQQTNINTAWIDGSMVYGSDATRAAWLRTYVNGKMKTSAGDLMPWNTVTGEYADAIDPNSPSMGNDANHTVKTFAAGDVRAAEAPGLTALHTLFVREHNRIADELVSQGLTNDEEIYQKARKRVGAIIQAITYQEFLPVLGVTLSSYYGYKNYVRPDIANTFATAGYRLGHTMVADELALRDDDCEELDPEALDLADVFFNPQVLVDFGLDPILKGFSTHKQYETDNKINSVLRNFLFGPGSGIDLASLNLQRGRDHGLPNFNAVRQYYTGCGVTNFSQITSDVTKQGQLQTLYGNVNNIDLWVGVLAEDRLSGKSVGKTVHAMLKSQFGKLRDGDYYFYKNDPYLSSTIRNQIINTKMSDVAMRNTSLTSLQSNVFFINPCPGENGEDRLAAAMTSGIENAGFGVYPNPVSDVVNVYSGNADVSCTIRLFTANGALVKNMTTIAGQKNLQIDMRDFGPGVFVVQIITNREIKSLRFVKLVD